MTVPERDKLVRTVVACAISEAYEGETGQSTVNMLLGKVIGNLDHVRRHGPGDEEMEPEPWNLAV